MAGKKLQATAELFLSTQNAQKDAQIFVNNLKKKLVEIESAADKMTVFKDVVEYIGNIDGALSALKAKNKDTFNHMFDGLDANLKAQLESVFGVDGTSLGQLNALKNTINSLTTKTSIVEIRSLAKSLNEVYESIGLAAPFEDISAQFKNKTNQGHIDAITNSFANFATVWKGVNDKISKGFGIGDGDINGISGLSKEVQDEIDKLKKQEEEINDILTAINSPKNVKVTLAQSSDKQVEQLQKIKDAYIEAEEAMLQAKKEFESHKLANTPEATAAQQKYYESMAKYIKTSAEVKSAFEGDKLTSAGSKWVMSSGFETLDAADKVFKNFVTSNSKMLGNINDMYGNQLASIEAQITLLSEKPYEVLREKMQEYASLNHSMDHEDRFSNEELDAIDEKIKALDKYFLALDQVGDKQAKIKYILGDIVMGGTADDAFNDLCEVLEIRVPNAALKAAEAINSVTHASPNSGVDAGNADDISKQAVDSANQTVNDLEYAKSVLVKAWQEYYDAVQNASINDVALDEGETSEEMDKIKKSIEDKIRSWKPTEINPSAWGLKYDLDLSEAIIDGDVSYDDIENFLNEQISFHGVSFNIPVEEIKLANMETNVEDAAGSIDADLGKVEGAIKDTSEAFKELISYISSLGTSPKSFFHKLAQGTQDIDGNLHNILSSLNLIDENDNVKFSPITSGYTNKGGFVSDQYTMIARLVRGQQGQDYLGKSEKLQEKLNDAKQAGAQIGSIIDIIKDESGKLFYEVQNTVSGTAAFSHHKGTANLDVLNATNEQLSSFVHTVQALSDNGLFIDFGGDNILYDKDKGFSIIDLGLVGDQYHTVSSNNTLQENLNRFVNEYFKYAPSNMDASVKSAFTDQLHNIAKNIGVGTPEYGSSKVSNAYDKKATASIRSEEAAHQENKEAIDAEAAAYQALIQLKEKAQNMKWKDFAKDESLTALKEMAGFTSLSQLEGFWKQSRYDKDIDFKELGSSSEMKQIIKSKLPKDISSKWYGPAKFEVKNQIENEILGDDELRNATLNYFYHLFKKHMPDQVRSKNINSFDDFLNTEFEMWRGDSSPLIFDPSSKLSVSLSKDLAESFSSNLGKIKIKPKNTIGNAASMHGSEVETFANNMYAMSWYKKANQDWEDWYSHQTEEMKNEIDIGLVKYEKQRLEELLGSDIIQYTKDAGNNIDFQNNALSKFQSGNIPDELQAIGSQVSQNFANMYNGLSNIDKQLVAYYACLSAVEKTLPEQFSVGKQSSNWNWDIEGKKIVGHDGDVMNAVLNDPKGAQKHLSKLTGGVSSGIIGQNVNNIDVEANMHKLNSQAIEEERQKQAQLNQEKQKSVQAYHDVTKKLQDDMHWEKDVPDVWNQLSDVLHQVQSVAGSLNDKDLIDIGGYTDNFTGEILQAKDLVQTIDTLMNNTGIDLSYVKDYLSDIYKNADLDAVGKMFDSVMGQDSSDYDSVSNKLKNLVESKETGSAEFNQLASVWHQLKNVDITSKSSSIGWLIGDGNFASDTTGEVFAVSDLYDYIGTIEQKYGENLQFVKNYLDQVYKNVQEPEAYKLDDDLLLDLDDDLLLDGFELEDEPIDKQDAAYKQVLNEYVNAVEKEKSDKINKLLSNLSDIQLAEKSSFSLDEGWFQTGVDGEVSTIDEVYALVADLQDTYSINLDKVQEYLNEVFANYNKKFDGMDTQIPDAVVDNVEDKINYYDVKDELFDEFLVSTDEGKTKKLMSLLDNLSDVNLTDEDLINQGKIQNVLDNTSYNVEDVYGLVDDIQQQYSINMDKVKEYLDQVYKNYLEQADSFDHTNVQDDDIGDDIKDVFDRPAKPHRKSGNGGSGGGDYALEGTLQQTNSILSSILSAAQSDNNKVPVTNQQTGDPTTQDTSPVDTFKQNLYNQTSAFNQYRDDLEGVEYISRSLREELDNLGTSLHGITTQKELTDWVNQFKNLKDNIKLSQSEFEQMNLGKINLYQKELTSSFNKLTLPQQSDMYDEYMQIIILLNKQKQSVKEGHSVELSGIQAITAALQEKINKQIEANKVAKDAEKIQKKNSKFGDTTMINATAKYNTLSKLSQGEQFMSSSTVQKAFQTYDQAYTKLKNTRNILSNKDDITSSDREAFKEATADCNNYAKALEKLIKDSVKLHGERVNEDPYMLGDDFDDSISSRKEALSNFAKEMYGVSLSSENFKNNFNEAIFAVKNGDGSLTQMTAQFTEARNEIVAMAGATKEATGFLGELWGQFKGKVKSIFTYLTASFSLHEAWAVVRQGVTYVKEIDTALTELKKVTDETDSSYANFLQNMSKTGGEIGATVKDLTTMAADWSRLGYSMEEAGELAKSTAILLNVSEFQDANAASEALISTMQAFQYTADESGHVVDILNEVKVTCLLMQ